MQQNYFCCYIMHRSLKQLHTIYASAIITATITAKTSPTPVNKQRTQNLTDSQRIQPVGDPEVSEGAHLREGLSMKSVK